MKDTLYRNRADAIKPFEFDQRVVDVFPDMIRRSVPGYPLTIAMIGVIAERYVQPGSRIYDLGCSLGAASFAVDSTIRDKTSSIIAIDSSEAMIASCQKHLEQQQSGREIQFQCEDITQTCIEQASLVILNFTLQFIPLNQRLTLLEKIVDGLLPGGALVLSEKIAFANKEEAELMQDLQLQMKALNGYDDMEIANKREALDQVLVPESIETHLQRLEEAGFQHSYTWLRCLNFCSLLALK